MKQKSSYNEIRSIEEDWSLDERNGLPYSGKSVQEFIKKGIYAAETSCEKRVGAAYYDIENFTIYYFKDEEIKKKWLNNGRNKEFVLFTTVLIFTSTLTQLKIINRLDTSNVYFTTTAEKALLSIGILSQQKGITDTSWEDVNEDFNVSVEVDKGSSGVYEKIISEQRVLNDNDFSVDVKKYLATGTNRVRISVTGVDTGTTKSFVYTVNLTSMYLSASDFAWAKVFVEGQNYSLGGMNIGGNLQKTLYIKVMGEGYEKLYDVNIGTAVYVNTAYFFSGLEHPSVSGVYHVEIWLDANGVESNHLNYNIICVATTDIEVTRFVAINEVADEVPNGMDKEIFGYTLYDKGVSQSSVSITLNIGAEKVTSETLSNVPTATKQYYTSSLEYDSEASELTVAIVVTNGNTITLERALDNSASYPATRGATLYINEAKRNNTQADRESFVNEVTGEEIAAEWEGIEFTGDAHIADETGRKALFVPAGAKVTINNQPLAKFGETGSKTIEFAFKVTNAADYEENIITIVSKDGRGIQIKPKNVLVQSRDLKDSVKQSYNLKDEEFVHIVITIVKEYQNYGNLCQIYVNGIKTTSFAFSGTDSFVTGSNIVLGSSSADLYLYKMRVYEQGFEWGAVTDNMVNSLATYEEKAAFMTKVKSILDDSYNVDYDMVYGKYNTFVVEMLDGAELPDKLHPVGGKCNTWINILNPIDDELDDDFKELFSGKIIENQEIAGQGTTAMTYLRWNLRQKLGSGYPYNKRRITAKKNVASSMHSHKMGATRMFNELHNAIVGANEAGARVAVYQYPVYGFQKFTEAGISAYRFIGLYTIGLDKGDKKSFGYDNEKYVETLIHLEGTDHTPMGVGFDYPYSELKYSASRGALGATNKSGDVVAAWEVNAAGGFATDETNDEENVKSMLDEEFKPAYDVVYNSSTFIKGLASDEFSEMTSDPLAWRKKTTEEGKSYSELEFYLDGVYDLWYYNTHDGIYKTNGINLLVQSGISSDLLNGLTLAEKDKRFKTYRREYFKAEMPKYWHLNDALFHDAFLIIIGASDNFKKNNYPYKFPLLADGGLWRRRQDDLDSIFDILNQGFAGKSYSVLFGDKTSSGSIFRGENSVFHTLMQECYGGELKRMVHSIFDKMAEISPYGQGQIERLAGYVKSRFWDLAQEYFTSSAYNADAEWTYEEAWKLYGTRYNNDVHPLQQSLGAHYEAERDWVELRMLFLASYFNWGVFAADNGDDATTGQMTYRAASGKTFTITPAIDFNPTVLVGQSDVYSAGGRVKAGEQATVIVEETGANDTHVYVQGLNWISDLGDLSDLQLTSDNTSLVLSSKRLKTLKIGDAVAENVTTNVGNMSLGSLPSLEEIDARNVTTLTGEINLEKCPRIKTALFNGTNVNSIVIADGSKISRLGLSDALKQLTLTNLPRLTLNAVEVNDLSNLEYLRVENCKGIDGYMILKAIFTVWGETNKITSIRLIGVDVQDGAAGDLTFLLKLAENTQPVTGEYKEYNGIDANGNVIPDTDSMNSIPIIEGTMNITTKVYEDEINRVRQLYGSKLRIAVPDGFYFKFADTEIARIVANAWGDGTGTTLEQIQSVTSLGTYFKGNTVIETFNELRMFTKVTAFESWDFRYCSALREIDLSNIVSLGTRCLEGTAVTKIESNATAYVGDYAFDNDLTEVVLNNVTTCLPSALHNSPNIVKLHMNNLETVRLFYHAGGDYTDKGQYLKDISFAKAKVLYGFLQKNKIIEVAEFPELEELYGRGGCLNSAIKRFVAPKLTTIDSQMFDGCSALEYIDLTKVAVIPYYGFRNTALTLIELNAVTEISEGAFANCTNLTLIISVATVPTLGATNAVSSVKAIYVLDSLTDSYKTATNWSSVASKIKPMSEFAESDS